MNESKQGENNIRKTTYSKNVINLFKIGGNTGIISKKIKTIYGNHNGSGSIKMGL